MIKFLVATCAVLALASAAYSQTEPPPSSVRSIDRSHTFIAAGNSLIASFNPNRIGLTLSVNSATDTCWYSYVGPAASGAAGSYPIKPQTPLIINSFAPSEPVNVYCPTANDVLSALETQRGN